MDGERGEPHAEAVIPGALTLPAPVFGRTGGQCPFRAVHDGPPRSPDGQTPHAARVMLMASGKQQQKQESELHGGVLSGDGSPGLWGALIGLVVFVFLAVPISIAVRFATHPATQQLFGGRLEEASNGAYVAFWWVIAIGLFAIPFLIGWAVAQRSGKTLSIIIGIVAVFFIAILILGQLF